MPQDFAIDTKVLMCASKLSDHGDPDTCVRFLERLKGDKDSGIVLDGKQKIIHEYDQKLRSDTYGKQWLRVMMTQGRVRVIPWTALDRGTRVSLQDQHFDPDDLRFVDCAKSSNCKVIVTTDDDFSPGVKAILRKRLEIRVLTPIEAISLLPAQLSLDQLINE